MDFDVFFIHGTGVRNPAYDLRFQQITRKLRELNNKLNQDFGHKTHCLIPQRCYWGDEHGTRLYAGGATIPQPSIALRGLLEDDQHLNPQEYNIGLWKVLYQQPLGKLEIMFESSKKSNPSWESSPDYSLNRTIEKFHPSSDLIKMLGQSHIEDNIFNEAYRKVVKVCLEKRIFVAARKEEFDAYYKAVAEAFVAETVLKLQTKYEDPTISFTSDLREQVVKQITQELSNGNGGLLTQLDSAAKGVLSNVIQSLIVNDLLNNRGRTSQSLSRAVGDVLMYQTRGQKIRDFIRNEINKTIRRNSSTSVVLIGHSLGGIACVDLLLENDPPPVKLLITVGSQAPFLYELNALVGMEYQNGANLPSSFRRWLNIYAERDLLSYIGEPVFNVGEPVSNVVRDVRVDIQEPFPQSHGAYWENQQMWDEIYEEIKQLVNI